ncbi:MAG: hypothetical protein HY550_01865 [Elusimicrobia bacterium]|nr:hypothetical protein [Elusimicrobiota bacterium]
MKYMQTGDFQNHPLMRLTLFWALLFISGLWVTNVFMYFSRMGLTPSSVQSYYLGSEEEYSQPRSAGSMLETTHAHLPVMGVVLLLLTHLLLFAPYSERFQRFFIAASFLSALLGEGAGWLVRFVHPGFAWLKIGSFLAFQACLGFLIAGLASFLLAAPRHPASRAHGRRVV